MNTQPLSGPIELFKASWAFYKSRWGALTAIVAVPYALTAVGSALNAAAARGQDAASLGLSFLGVILSIGGAVLSAAATVGFIQAVDAMHADPAAKAPLGPTYKAGFKLFWAFVLVSIIRGAMTFGGVALFIVPAIVMGVYAVFSLMTLVLDGKHGLSAFTESFALVRGRWWGVFGRILFMALCCLVMFLVILGAFFFLQAVTGPIPWLFNFVLLVLLVPFALAYYYELYRSAKATRSQAPENPAFKRWLVAFIAIGVLALIALPVIALSALRSPAPWVGSDRQALSNTPANGDMVK